MFTDDIREFSRVNSLVYENRVAREEGYACFHIALLKALIASAAQGVALIRRQVFGAAGPYPDMD